ncbi:hypothetical protein, partial [Bacillus coreaensis]
MVYCPNHLKIRTLKNKNLGVLSESPKDSDSQEQNLGVLSESPKDSDSQEQKPWCPVRITKGFGLSRA